LLFLSGDLSPEILNDVPQAEPGVTVHVSSVIKLPMTPKQYTGYYRLATKEGKKFGPRIWVDVLVIRAEPENMEQAVSAKPIDPPISISTESAVLASEISKLEAVQKVSEHKDLEKEPKKSEESNLGKNLDVFREEAKSPKEESQSIKEEPKVTKEESKATKEEFKATKAESVLAPNSPYAIQLEILIGMGFKDAQLNSYLLANNEGNVQRVVEWMLSHEVH